MNTLYQYTVSKLGEFEGQFKYLNEIDPSLEKEVNALLGFSIGSE